MNRNYNIDELKKRAKKYIQKEQVAINKVFKHIRR